MNDRRRINGPSGGTTAKLSSKYLLKSSDSVSQRPVRTRPPNALRKMFLRTGVTPSASGSAYLELAADLPNKPSITPTLASLTTSGLKLACTVHGPKPLPRSAPFSPTIVLTAHVKYAPFATRQRRGYVRDASERDLAVHVETALRGVIIGDRWPKSGVEVIITILEGDEDRWIGDGPSNTQILGSAGAGQLGTMNILSGCITVASAAIADAGIDCVDMVSGGVAALVRDQQYGIKDLSSSNQLAPTLVLDPVPSEHDQVLAACVVSYLPTRDEITDIWVRGEMGNSLKCYGSIEITPHEKLADNAVKAALGSHCVLMAAVKETAENKIRRLHES